MEKQGNFVYILSCGDGSLYTGWTNDPDRRVAAHSAGRGAKYTKARLPVHLVYLEALAEKSAAMRREYEIKQLTRAQKLELIASGPPQQKEDAPLEQHALLETGIPGCTLRFAQEEDTPAILYLIRELADYEKLLHEVTATEEVLRDALFTRRQAQVLLADYQGETVGYALFFHNFSTFLGHSNLYLEDLYIRPTMRGKGLGKAVLSCLGRIALDRGCRRLDWWCLDWNAPSIAFYKSLGAKAMEDWTVYRMEGEALERLAGK